MGVHHDVHYGAIAAMLRDPAGGVAKDMLRRGLRVQAQARRNLDGANGKPRRVDTGRLRAGIYVRPIIHNGRPGAEVGSRERYSRWVHYGTGIYGPRHRPITARGGGYLRFVPKGSKSVIFVRSVKGMRANPYLSDALIAARY